MIADGQIIEGFQELIKGLISASFVGEVLDNSEAETKALVKVGFNELEYDVKLKSVVDGASKHLLLIPKQNSRVLCVTEGNSAERFAVLAFNELDKIIYKGENTGLMVDDVNSKIEMGVGDSVNIEMLRDKIVFNKKALKSFMCDLNKLTSKINTLEQDLNSLKTVLSTFVPVPSDGAVGTKSGGRNLVSSKSLRLQVLMILVIKR